MMKTITELYTDHGQEYILGKGGVISIDEHIPTNKGDKLYYEVEFRFGQFHKEFNPDTVVFEEDQEDEEEVL